MVVRNCPIPLSRASALPPVIAIGPVGAQRLQLFECDALRRIRRRLRPPCSPQPLAEIVEVDLGNR